MHDIKQKFVDLCQLVQRKIYRDLIAEKVHVGSAPRLNGKGVFYRIHGTLRIYGPVNNTVITRLQHQCFL